MNTVLKLSSLIDTLQVFDDEQLVGEVVLMSDGWAAYTAGPTGRIRTTRIGTYPTINDAVRSLTDKEETS